MLDSKIEKVTTEATKAATGVDETTITTIYYKNGITARTKSSWVEGPSNYAKIIGDKGYIYFEPINVPDKIEPISMPHAETIRIMGWMDSIRYHEGVVFPFETVDDIRHDNLEVWGTDDVASVTP